MKPSTIDDKIIKLSEEICGQMDDHLVESIISLFNNGVLVHYVRSPRSEFDSYNCKMTINSASGVRFEGREKLIELEQENNKLREEIMDLSLEFDEYRAELGRYD